MTFRRKTASRALRTSGRRSLGAPYLLWIGTATIIVLGIWAFLVSDRVALLAAALAGPLFALVLYRRSLAASRLALTDRLTGLGNDRRFAERLERDLERAEIEAKPLALCLLDVDDFKRINDGFGHPAGDRVLAEIAALLRHGGEAFRLGGDEFALLLYGQGERSALHVAQAVVHRVAEAQHGHGSNVTVSVGVVVYPGQEPARTELVRAADSALYRAKAEGKNRVCVFRSDAGWLPGLQRLTAPSERIALLQAASILLQVSRASGMDAERERAAADLAGRVALRMGLSSEQVELIRLAGLLNDIGKLALSDSLLSKEGPLSEDEREQLRRHPQIGHEILESLGVGSVATWILHHHERWDGQGYPEGLAGERIPLGARILSVADAFDAMTSDQFWQPRLARADAIRELRRCAGSQFDPVVVEAFVAELAAEPRRAAVA